MGEALDSGLVMFDPSLDPSALTSSNWPSLVAVAAGQAGTAMLILTAAFLVLTVLIAIFQPPDPLEAFAVGSACAGGLALAVAPAGSYLPSAHVPVAAGQSAGRPAVADQSKLHGIGLQPADVIALTALRQRVQTGQVSEGPTIAGRLGFARWLAEQGKLQG